MTLIPFAVRVSDAELIDLRRRLQNARFAGPAGTAWTAGISSEALQRLIKYWGNEFDWPAAQARLNAFHHFRPEVRGAALHFIRLPAHPSAGGIARLPLLLCHGWPSSFLEMLPLAERLSDPARFGAPRAQAFEVIVPSLPGFLFSGLPAGPLTRRSIAASLHSLMTEVLGHDRYGAFGGDIGGAAVGWLGAEYPEHVAGIHLIHPPAPSHFAPPPTAAEQAFIDREEEYDRSDGGYSEIMRTRPDTIAAALLDSPTGLAAWIVDKLHDWTDGDFDERFSADDLCTLLTLYWVTSSIGTSFRQYFDWPHNPPRPTIAAPTSITLSHEPGLAGFPRSIAERAAPRITRWSEPRRGGHFLAFEEPDLMTTELRDTFSAGIASGTGQPLA